MGPWSPSQHVCRSHTSSSPNLQECPRKRPPQVGKSRQITIGMPSRLPLPMLPLGGNARKWDTRNGITVARIALQLPPKPTPIITLRIFFMVAMTTMRPTMMDTINFRVIMDDIIFFCLFLFLYSVVHCLHFSVVYCLRLNKVVYVSNKSIVSFK